MENIAINIVIDDSELCKDGITPDSEGLGTMSDDDVKAIQKCSGTSNL